MNSICLLFVSPSTDYNFIQSVLKSSKYLTGAVENGLLPVSGVANRSQCHYLCDWCHLTGNQIDAT